MSPTARSLEVLRELGYRAEVVERWLPRTTVRKDLFGFIDIIAVHIDHGIIGIQATTGANAAARTAKALQQEGLSAWLAHARAEVWSWSKKGPRGKPKRWTLVRRPLKP